MWSISDMYKNYKITSVLILDTVQVLILGTVPEKQKQKIKLHTNNHNVHIYVCVIVIGAQKIGVLNCVYSYYYKCHYTNVKRCYFGAQEHRKNTECLWFLKIKTSRSLLK